MSKRGNGYRSENRVYILKNSLIVEGRMPECFKRICAVER
jgi:hypothetical protein